jgi:uncharacterized protein YjbI with pentapeptide repeats
MANQQHLEFLRKGTVFWNRWRADNPNTAPDLSAANLSGANLRGADLRSAVLAGADLSGADLGVNVVDAGPLFEAFGVSGAPKSLVFASLQGANLTKASLSGADLTAADLRSANLTQTDLSFSTICAYSVEPGAMLSYGMTFPANLAGARLHGASLYKTTFRETVFRKTSFAQALIAETIFSEIDLAGIADIQEAVHLAPSRIDVQTLELTASKLQGRPSPAIQQFLRGCGLPDEYLESFEQRSTSGSFYSCFVSHSSEDQEFCRKLCLRMREEGFRVWYAPDNMRGGRRLFEQIKAAISGHDKLLMVLSEVSIASSWVELEIREALRLERETGRRILFPIAITDFERIKSWELVDSDTGQDLAVRVREYFVLDFSSWMDGENFELMFHRLASDLRRLESAVPRWRNRSRRCFWNADREDMEVDSS